ncbi:uncharacterized protein LOC143363824 [Halictus rubicundus]|uniref:uncharacterized protein LOC143363824 n=1 Tax=Halictus rubicundus TaxID=77578 RepID=UPI004035E51D
MPPRKRKNTPAARSEDSTPNAKRSCGASRGAAATENSQPVLPASSDVQPAEQEYGVASLRRARAEESSPSSRRNSQEGGNYGASRPGAAAQTRREDVTLEDDLEVPLPTRERNFCNSPSILASTRWEANPTERLTEAIVNTLRTVREASMAEGDSRLLHRLTTAKKLPKFSGNPIEWLNFKEAYLSSAELGGYCRRENVARLFDALEGEARASVTALLATASDANVIIETLELQFGNKNTIAEKIASDISGLPNLDPELIKIVANKLPSALRYAFNRYAAEAAAEKTTLEKLADFVYREAELAAATSIFDTDIPSTSYVRDSQIKKKPSRLRTAATYTTTHGLRRLEKGYTGPSDQTGRTDRCAFCSRSNHKSRQCRDLARETIQKRWALVRKNKLCFKCLDRGHGSKQCKGANCDHCDKPHHSLLHKTKASAGNFQATRKQGPASNRSQEATTCPKKPVITYALLDEGSTITLIERKLAREIGARGPRLNFALKGINDREAVTVASEKVELEIQGAFDAYAIKHAISVPDLNLPLQTLSVEIVERVKFTENVNVQAYSNARPRLLLGQDQWQMIATREFRELKRYMLGISRSLLGWAVHGSMPAGLMESAFSGVNEMKSISSCEMQVKKEEERLDELVKQYFQLDNFGVSNTNKTKNEHTYAVQTFRNTARKVDNPWEVGLLWRKEPAPQVDSLATARQRLFSLERKLDRDPEYASLYYQEMDRLIKNGYAERVDRDSTNERVWYLPHFGVRNTNKPGRVRLVFDAAAKSAGISLNDQLESGPDLLQSLPGVLIRFRQEVLPEAENKKIDEMEMRKNVFWPGVLEDSSTVGEELEALRSGKEVHKSSRIVKLQPLVDENGILRASGRVTKVKGFEFNNNPIILDGKHPATRSLVAEYHRRFYHASHDAVVNELRQEFCIVGLRNTLRSLISKCLVCKIRRGKPQDPKMATLPAGRLAYRERPFSHCGVDYFGPLCVKIGRRREKRWGVLFTCLTTRAIHLDLAHSLSASSAIMASQRLAARRGSPLAVYSDNGTNFVRASKELKDAIAGIDTEKQKEYAASKRIKWLFNPPDAPHMGGAWERMIRSVKTALDTVLRDQATSEEVLVTLLAEIEHSVNSRPLTHVSVDPRDNEALTPNHFLIGTSSGEIRLGAYEFRAICPRNQWRIAQSFADAFWKRWLKEYLPTLIPRTKWNRTARPLAVGDLVIIIDYQTPRNVWKRGTVIDVYPSVDGEVRIAKPNVRKQQQVLFVAVKPYMC